MCVWIAKHDTCALHSDLGLAEARQIINRDSNFTAKARSSEQAAIDVDVIEEAGEVEIGESRDDGAACRALGIHESA